MLGHLERGSFSVVQKSSVAVKYAVPAGGGTLTSWSVAAGPNTDTFQLEVWRPAGTDTFTLVFISSPQVILANSGVHTFTLSPPVSVNADDRLGLVNTLDDGYCLQSTGNSGDVVDATFAPTPSVGDTRSDFISFDGWQVNVAANFAPPEPPTPPSPPTPGTESGAGVAVAVVATPAVTG